LVNIKNEFYDSKTEKLVKKKKNSREIKKIIYFKYYGKFLLYSKWWLLYYDNEVESFQRILILYGCYFY